MYVCVCIFRYIHTSYIQPVSHTYTYRHAGSLMVVSKFAAIAYCI
jgi:hypothetical protein